MVNACNNWPRAETVGHSKGGFSATVPEDYYSAVIRQRNAPEAADLLADECRKKDRAIAELSKGMP